MRRLRAFLDRPVAPFLVVGAGVAAAQLLVSGVGRQPSWDEAIYLSQADPRMPALPFAASRARGIVVLVWPLVRFGLPLPWIRGVLIVASSSGVVAASAAWAPVIGRRPAASAAALFGGSWLVLFYGGEVMPNLWVALALLWAGGLLAQGLASQAARPPTAALVLLGVAALLRPLDAVVVSAAFGVAILWMGAYDRRLVWLAWLGLVVGLGAAPWVVEMSVRFGGPFGALRAAADVGHVGGGAAGWEAVRQHLALGDGPLLGPERPPVVPAGVLAWWLVALALGIRSLGGSDAARRTGGRVALLAGVVAVGAYAGLVSGLAPRFLLPGAALLTVAAVAGAGSLPRAARAGFAVAAAVWFAWQLSLAGSNAATAFAGRADAAAAGFAIREAAGRGSCVVLASEAYPQVGYASRCVARPLPTRAPEDERPPPELAGAFIVVGDRDPHPWPAALGSPVASVPGWRIYRVP